jgi:molecular chaperone DnaK
MKLSRAKLEDISRDFIERSAELMEQTIRESGLNITDIDEVLLVGGQTRMPAIQDAVKKLFNKDPHKGINPDEVVAVGAAVQGGILQGEVRDVLLLDVVPLSFGIETLGSVMTRLIEKNTTIPTSKSQVFSTAADNQTSVEIHVLQGERPMAQDNKTLGRFILDGIPPSPRGVPQVEVTFDIDVNGILNVTAKDRATGKSQSIRIEGSTGLSKEEVERLRKEAEAYAAEDQNKREFIETKNQADALLYTAERTIRELGEKIKPEDKKEIEEKMGNLRGLVEKKDNKLVKQATDALSQVLQRIGAAMYQEAQKTQTKDANPPSQEKKEGEEPQEGEYDKK